MKQKTAEAPGNIHTEEVLNLLDGYISSAVLIAAIEHGIFWLLETNSMDAEDIAKNLHIPIGRCRYWLQYLCKMGYLAVESNSYNVTDKARAAIMVVYSHDTWALLANESRERYPPFQYFSTHLGSQGSLWQISGVEPPNYVEQMNADTVRARRFTRMLYEIHRDLAEEIAVRLDMREVHRLLDLGGGSGIVSTALIRQNPKLEVVVLDIPNVCEAGRELAQEAGITAKLLFHPADFMQDELPIGFDMVLECDVGVYNEILFEKIRHSLTPEGRYVILDQFAPAPGIAPGSRLSWALQGSLRDPDFQYNTATEIVRLLEDSGFSDISVQQFPVSRSPAERFSKDMYIIEAKT